MNDFWPAYFPQRKLTGDKSSKLEKAFWELIFTTEDCREVYEYLKLFFRMCTNINNYIPVCPSIGHKNEEEQCGYGNKDDMTAKFKQDLY